MLEGILLIPVTIKLRQRDCYMVVVPYWRPFQRRLNGFCLDVGYAWFLFRADVLCPVQSGICVHFVVALLGVCFTVRWIRFVSLQLEECVSVECFQCLFQCTSTGASFNVGSVGACVTVVLLVPVSVRVCRFLCQCSVTSACFSVDLQVCYISVVLEVPVSVQLPISVWFYHCLSHRCQFHCSSTGVCFSRDHDATFAIVLLMPVLV